MLTLLSFILPAYTVMFLTGQLLARFLPEPQTSSLLQRLPHLFILQAAGFALFLTLTITLNRFIPHPEHSLVLSALILVTLLGFTHNHDKASLRAPLSSFPLFLLTFLSFLLLRGYFSTLHYSPQESGAEKFFNLSLLQSISVAKAWPAENIWYAQEPLQYYLGSKAYAGWILGILPPRLQDTALVFHMMEALHHTLAFLCAFFAPVAILTCLEKPPRPTTLGLIFAFNPYFAYPLVSLVTGTEATSHWDLTRIIPNTINEYPFWNFTWSDGHAHTGSAFLLPIFFYFLFLMNQFRNRMSLPLTLAGLSSFIALSQNPSVITVGISSVAFFALTLRERQQFIGAMLFAGASLLFSLPEVFTHQFPRTTTHLVPAKMTTQLTDLLNVHFVSLFLPYLLFFSLGRQTDKAIFFLLFTVLLLLLPLAFHSATLWALLTVGTVLYRSQGWEKVVIIPLILLIFPEFIISDFNHSEKLLRWNTVFKFYYDIYFIAPVFILVPLFTMAQRSSRAILLQQRFWLPAITAVALSLAVTSHWLTAEKNPLGNDPWSLDGFSYLASHNHFIFKVTRHLLRHRGENIVEACGIAPHPASYAEYGRVAALTATRTACGWSSHTLLHSQHTEAPLKVGGNTYRDHLSRASQIESVFTLNGNSRWDFIKRFNIKYIVLGRLEKKIPGVKSPRELETEYGRIVLQVGEEALIRITPEKIPGLYE